MRTYLDRYRQVHQHPTNHLMHMIGIPILLISLPILLWDWKLAFAVGFVGWIFQFTGHAFEKKFPPFFKNPVFLVVGPYWWMRKITGREDTTP